MMMAKSLIVQDYEAVAAYDREHSSAENKAVLILDTSSCAAALGVYQENGKPQIEGIWNPDAEATLEAQVNSTFAWSSHAADLKNAVRKYYLSERSVDPTVPGLDQSVSAIVHFCEEIVSGSLGIVFRSADSLLENLSISPMEMRILLLGQLSSFFPLEAAVRCHYSPAMPMMPDSRYQHYPDLDHVLREGRELLEQYTVKQIKDPVVWQIYQLQENQTTELNQIFLASPDTRTADLETPVYADLGEVFVCSGDMLTVYISGSQHRIPVPEELLQNGVGTVDLGLQYRDENFFLLIRSSRTSKVCEHPVNISLKGNP